MAFRTHRGANGKFVSGKHCANHRTKRNPQLSPFDKLERKIARGERKRHPAYSADRIQYIAQAAAGKVARERRGKR
jgi:hypothetical protein